MPEQMTICSICSGPCSSLGQAEQSLLSYTNSQHRQCQLHMDNVNNTHWTLDKPTIIEYAKFHYKVSSR